VLFSNNYYKRSPAEAYKGIEDVEKK